MSYLGPASFLAVTIFNHNLASCSATATHHQIGKIQIQVAAPFQIKGLILISIVFFASIIWPFLISLDSFFDLLALVGNLFDNLKVVLGSGETGLVQARSHMVDIHPPQLADSGTSMDIAHSYITAIVKFGAQADNPVFLLWPATTWKAEFILEAALSKASHHTVANLALSVFRIVAIFEGAATVVFVTDEVLLSYLFKATSWTTFWTS